MAITPEPGALKRAYDEIKRLILAGELVVRTHIDVDALARAIGVSVTPVRQAMSLLSSERLIRLGGRSGFEVALWSERELANLYAWRGALLSLALPSAASSAELKRIARLQPYPQSASSVMRLLEEGANPELKIAALNADERLQAARRVEPEVLGDVQAEFETLVNALADRSKRAGALARSYHRRRVQHARQLRERVVLRALPNNGNHGS